MEAPPTPCSCHHCQTREINVTVTNAFGNLTFPTSEARNQWMVEVLTAISGYLGTEGRWE